MVGPGRAGSPIAFFYKDQTSEPLRGKNLIKGREGGEIKTVLFWNIRNGARTRRWQGAGATLVARIAATRLLSLLRISKTKHYLLH